MSSRFSIMKSVWPRSRAGLISVAALAATLVVFGVCETLGWPFLRYPLSRVLTNAIGLPVALDGEFKLHVVGPPRLITSSLVIGAANGVDVKYLVQADNLALGWRWLDAWRAARGGPIVIKSLTATQLQANFVRLKDGRASWTIDSNDVRSINDPGPARDTPLPRVQMLHLGKGEVKFIDETTATKLMLTANSTADGRGMDMSASGSFRALEVDVTAHADDTFALVQDDGTSQDIAVRMDGKAGSTTISFEGQAGGLLSARRLNGVLRLRSASLASVGEPLGITLPQTPPFDLQGTLAQDNGIWQLDAQKFMVGNSALNGNFKFDSTATPPMLTGRLSGSRLHLADLGPSVGGEVKTSAQSNSGFRGRRVLPERKFDLPSLSAMNAKLEVDIAQLDLNTTVLAPLSRLQANVDLNDGVLKVEDLHAVASGGEVSGAMKLDGRGDRAKWTADLNFRGVDVAKWLRVGNNSPEKRAAAKAGAAVTNKRSVSYLTGELAATLKVNGAGQSTAAIIGSLTGQIDALIKNGSISHLLVEAFGLDLAQGLGILISGDDALPMRCARLQLTSRNGVATVDRGVVDNNDTTLLMTGDLSLREETLALKAVAKPKDVSLFTVRSPVHITGPWSSPNIRLEAGKIAGKAIASIVLGAIAGPAALLPFIDLGSETSADPCTRTSK